MELDNPTIVAITSSVIAILALLWAIYTHLSTRKISKLTYNISQLFDFGVPDSFLVDMPDSPIAVTVTSRGNKGTENIVIQLKTQNPIEKFEFTPSSLQVVMEDNELNIQADRLNPSQQIKLFIRCSGNPLSDQISELNVSHSDGIGVVESEVKALSISIMGIKFEYNPISLKTSLVRFGPISFK